MILVCDRQKYAKPYILYVKLHKITRWIKSYCQTAYKGELTT